MNSAMVRARFSTLPAILLLVSTGCLLATVSSAAPNYQNMAGQFPLFGANGGDLMNVAVANAAATNGGASGNSAAAQGAAGAASQQSQAMAMAHASAAQPMPAAMVAHPAQLATVAEQQHQQQHEPAGMLVMPAQPEHPFRVFGMQNGAGASNYNNYVSKVSIGNSKNNNVNYITSNGGQSSSVNLAANNPNGSIKNSPLASAATASSGETTGPDGAPKKKKFATQEQIELKKKLLEMADKAAANTLDGNEPLLKLNSETGELEEVSVDPNAKSNAEKLKQAIDALKARKLPADELRELLNDIEQDGGETHADHGAPHAGEQEAHLAPEESGPPADEQAVPEFEMEPEPELELGPSAEELDAAEADAAAAEHQSLLDEVRANLDDRLNRISDLLYFRPEFMNQLLNVDDTSELTPVEAEFKRMILCNSDEQFCGPFSPPAAPAEEAEPVVESRGPSRRMAAVRAPSPYSSGLHQLPQPPVQHKPRADYRAPALNRPTINRAPQHQQQPQSRPTQQPSYTRVQQPSYTRVQQQQRQQQQQQQQSPMVQAKNNASLRNELVKKANFQQQQQQQQQQPTVQRQAPQPAPQQQQQQYHPLPRPPVNRYGQTSQQVRQAANSNNNNGNGRIQLAPSRH